MVILTKHEQDKLLEHYGSVADPVVRGVITRLIGSLPESGNPHAEVRVIALRGDKVRLGITAPKCIKVHRLEVFYRVSR